MTSQAPHPPAPPSPSLSAQLYQLQLMDKMLRAQADMQAERVGMLRAQAADQLARAVAIEQTPPEFPGRAEEIAKARAQAQVLNQQAETLFAETGRLLMTIHGGGGAIPAGAAEPAPAAPPPPPPPKPIWQRGEFWAALWRVSQALTAGVPLAEKHKDKVGERAYGALRRAATLLAKASAQAQRAQQGAELGNELAELLGDTWARIQPMPWHLCDVTDGSEIKRQMQALITSLPAYVPGPLDPEETPETLAEKVLVAMEAAGSKEAPNGRKAQEHLAGGRLGLALRGFEATTPPDPYLYEMRLLRIMLEQRAAQQHELTQSITPLQLSPSA